MANSWNGNGKIIFKQGVSKEEKIKFFSIISCVAIPYIAIIIITAMYQYDMKALIVFLLMCFFPLFVLTILMGMNYLEWYCIYDDRIEVRCPFGKKNVVYYNNVLFVEEVGISLTARGKDKLFYIFNDGRNNNGSIFNVNSCYNKRKYNVRIYKTSRIESYIISKGWKHL